MIYSPIPDEWKRIAGICCSDDGNIAAVWLAWDSDTDIVRVYDACRFRREVLAVIAEGLNARGRRIPVAWDNKEIADKLLDRGCNMLPESSSENAAMSDVASRDVLERMRTGRFKVDKNISEWLEEYKTFNRQDAKVPIETHPLMAATRYAVSELQYARSERGWKASVKTYPKVAMI